MLPQDGYPEESESPMEHLPNIKGFKELVKSLEVINDADEDEEKDERDLTSVDDENVLISQDTLEPYSPEVKRGSRQHPEIIIKCPQDLRKIKYEQGLFRKSASMEEIKMFSHKTLDDDTVHVIDEHKPFQINVVKVDESSRNEKQFKMNVMDCTSPKAEGDEIRSRNNYVPQFNISATNPSDDI